MAHVSGQVLTDGPAVTLLVLACLLGVRAVSDPGRDAAPPNARGSAGAPSALVTRVPWAFGAGVAIGLAAGVREQAIVNGLTFAALPLLAPRGLRWRVAAAIAAGACLALLLPLIHVWITQPAYAATVRAWVANMGRDRTVRTYGLADAGTLAVWLLSLGPIVVAAGAAAIVRGRTWWTPRPLLIAIVVPALIQMAWLATLRGVGYSPRFLLGALPLAFAIPGSLLAAAWAGESSARWRGLVAAWVLPVVVVAPVVHARSAALTGILRAWPARLQALPAGALVITGQPCPAVPLVASIVRVEARGTAVRPPDDEASRWEAVCPGWAWPDDLNGVVDRALASGHLVAADLRPAAWTGPEQQAALAVLSGVVDAHAAAARAGRLVVWRADRE
jgi:hypothetical protein